MRGKASETTGISYRNGPAFDRRNPLIWLILGGTLLIVAIVAGTAFAISNFRERAVNRSERELENSVCC